MNYLRINHNSISNDNYNAITQIYSSVDNTVHYFYLHKTTTFNLKKLKKIYSEARTNIDFTKEVIKIPSDENIKNIANEFIRCYIKAVFSYTPFIRIKFINKILFILLLIGFTKASQIIRYLEWLFNEAENSNLIGINLSRC